MRIRIVERPPRPAVGDLSRVLFLLPSEGEPTAEDLAMLQALYSRDPRPIDDNVKLLKTANAGEFMEKFYVGYDHASVGELGDLLIAIENVPIIVAKLIQHFPLYRGQEASTRYLNWSQQPFIARTVEGRNYQEKLRAFYVRSFPQVVKELLNRFELDTNDPVDVKAARAGAFDILRGYLTAGATTSLSWVVNLRDLNTRLEELAGYGEWYPEIRPVVDKIQSLFEETAPHSVVPTRNKKLSPLLQPVGRTSNYQHQVSVSSLQPVQGQNRALVEWSGLLDLGSWRDLARHRAVFQTFPELDYTHDVEQWYIENLPGALQEEARRLLLEAPQVGDPLAFPLAYNVPFLLSGMLDKFEYLINLRSSPTVHQTLRNAIFSLTDLLRKAAPELCSLDPQNREWKILRRRGQQDIQQVA